MRPDDPDAARISDMLEWAHTARGLTRGLSVATYASNQAVKLAVERCIELIGEAASHVSPQFRSAHPDIEWRTIVAQRNILAHGYAQVKDERIWQVVTDDLPNLISQLEVLVFPLEEA